MGKTPKNKVTVNTDYPDVEIVEIEKEAVEPSEELMEAFTRLEARVDRLEAAQRRLEEKGDNKGDVIELSVPAIEVHVGEAIAEMIRPPAVDPDMKKRVTRIVKN